MPVLGVTGIPIVIGAGQTYDLATVLMASLLITLVFTFILLFEQNSLMRAGKFIKEQLEAILLSRKPLRGWEHWLQADESRRKAESFFEWSAYMAFVLYFLLGTYLAYPEINQRFGAKIANAALGVYSGGLLLALYLVVTNLPIGKGKNK